MTRSIGSAWLLAMPLLCLAADAGAVRHEHGEEHSDLGTVNLPTSCSTEASAQIQRGLALLHHMMYEAAESAFLAATRAQPSCATAYWGQAMTFGIPSGRIRRTLTSLRRERCWSIARWQRVRRRRMSRRTCRAAGVLQGRQDES